MAIYIAAQGLEEDAGTADFNKMGVVVTDPFAGSDSESDEESSGSDERREVEDAYSQVLYSNEDGHKEVSENGGKSSGEKVSKNDGEKGSGAVERSAGNEEGRKVDPNHAEESYESVFTSMELASSDMSNSRLALVHDKDQKDTPSLNAPGESFNKKGKKKTRPKQILRSISAYFNPGELVAIMGPSGCGKTTLLDLLTSRRKGGFIKVRGVYSVCNHHPTPPQAKK